MNIEKLVTSPTLIERSNFDICLVDPDTLTITSVSKGLLQHSGYHRDHLLGSSLSKLNAEFNDDRLRTLLRPLISGEQNNLLIDTKRRHHTGEIIDVEGCAQYISLPNGETTLLIMSRHKDEPRPQRQPSNLVQELLNHCPGMVAITDRNLSVISINERFLKHFRCHFSSAIGTPLEMLLMPKRLCVFDKASLELKTTGHWQHTVWCEDQDKNVYPLEVKAEHLSLAHSSEPLYLFSIHESLSPGHMSHSIEESEVLHRLLNRKQFINTIMTAASEQTEGCRLSVLMLDIEKFAKVNERFGYDQANQLLYAIGNRLENLNIGAIATAYLGSDQFALMIRTDDFDSIIEPTVDQLIARLTMPYRINNKIVHTTIKIGVSVSNPDVSPSSLLQMAEHALNQVKKTTASTWTVFNEGKYAEAIQLLEYEEELRSAVSKKQFALLFQPQLDLATGEVKSAETLLRWNHPHRGTLPPGDFISLLEDTNLIIELGDWIIEQACEFIQYWQSHNLQSIRVAVNVSAKQLVDERIVGVVKRAIQRTGISPRFLELEVTESCLIDDSKKTTSILNEIQALGVTIAMDDFGTGYSSLNHIRELPLNIIKIDKSFIDGIERSSKDRSIINVIIQMAKLLGILVVAEGVENHTQLKYLKDAKCNMIQGFVFARPMAAVEFEQFLLNSHQHVIKDMEMKEELTLFD